jgi:hypothetical protein
MHAQNLAIVIAFHTADVLSKDFCSSLVPPRIVVEVISYVKLLGMREMAWMPS